MINYTALSHCTDHAPLVQCTTLIVKKTLRHLFITGMSTLLYSGETKVPSALFIQIDLSHAQAVLHAATEISCH